MRISSAWPRSTRPIETPNVSAWRIASTNDRISGHVDALFHRPHRLGARRAGADLAEHAGELVLQRTGHGHDRAVERLLETETGLDADHEQVEHVGQLPADLLLTLGDAAVEHRVGTKQRAAARRGR